MIPPELLVCSPPSARGRCVLSRNCRRKLPDTSVYQWIYLFIVSWNLVCTPVAGSFLPPRLAPTSDPMVLQALEKNLLEMFGLSRRPMPRGPVHIPVFMRELYKQHTDLDSDESPAPLSRIHPTYSANTIRSFLQEEPDSAASSGDDALAEAHLSFNISAVQPNEDLMAAELRILTHPANLSYEPEVLQTVLPRYRLEVHDILSPLKRKNSSERITRLLDTRVVSSSRSLWESLDVSPAIHRWLQQPSQNFGLLVRMLHPEEAEPAPEEHLQHVRLKRSIGRKRRKEREWAAEQPMLVTYSHDGRGNKKSGRPRRSSKKKHNKKTRKRKHLRCKRHSLSVHFQDVGWNDWILAPAGYEAFYCQGECPSHLSDHLNATNHAIVQTLVNSVNSQAVPKPCCVPTELIPISLLYMDEYGKVTLKNYQDMVVTACGCR